MKKIGYFVRWNFVLKKMFWVIKMKKMIKNEIAMPFK